WLWAVAEVPRARAAGLLDLGFLEDDVLARDRVVLLELELFSRGARVLARDVVVAGVGRTHELDHDRRLLGHGAPGPSGKRKGGKIQPGPFLSSGGPGADPKMRRSTPCPARRIPIRQ